MNTHSDQISLRRYLDPVRRFAPLVLIGTLLGAGLGFGAHTLTGTTYTSYVSVLVSPISGDPVDGLGTSGADVDMATEAEVATSLLVAERANDLLAGQPPAKDPRDLLGQVETSVRGTRIIEMAFTATEPEIAQRGAAAFADAFLDYRNELATSQLEVSSGRLAERIAQLQLELTDVSTRRAEVPESQREGAAYAALVINEQTLLDELSVNQGRLADLRAVITDDAVVLDSASLPRAPSSMGLTTLVVGGAAAGFVSCAGLALMLDAARRRNEDDEFTETHAVRHVLETAAADVTAPTAHRPGVAPVAGDLATASPTAPTPAAPSGVDSPDDLVPAAEAPRTDPFTVTDTPMPDPFVVDEGVEDVWGRPDNGDATDSWSSVPDISAGEAPAAGPAGTDDRWAAPLSGSDEDAWAGIVEAAGGTTDGGSALSTSWDTPGTAGDDLWAAPAPGSWDAEPSGADAMGGATDTAAPIDLDELLQDRARASVAQLGEHLTNAVDVERRAVVVVDGGDGAALPVAVAVAAHLAATGRRTLLVDPHGEALMAATPGRYDVRGHPTLEVLVGDAASDHLTLVADAAGEDTMVVFAGAAIGSPLVGADGDWAGAIVIATKGVADPTSIPGDAFERVMGSRHPLIGIVSIMARPALAPPGY